MKGLLQRLIFWATYAILCNLCPADASDGAAHIWQEFPQPPPQLKALHKRLQCITDPPILNLTNAALDDVLCWIANSISIPGDGFSIGYVDPISNEKHTRYASPDARVDGLSEALPRNTPTENPLPVPEYLRVELVSSNATYEQVLECVASQVNLQWRYVRGLIDCPAILLARSEWIDDNFTRYQQTSNQLLIQFLCVCIMIYIIPPMFFSIFPLRALEELSINLLGKEYRTKLCPTWSKYLLSLLTGQFWSALLPFPPGLSEFASASHIRSLLKSDCDGSLEYAHRILFRKYPRMNHPSCRAFFERNLRARDLFPDSWRLLSNNI